MNNNPNCRKRCLECYHCEPRCIQSCRDCHRCKTFMLEPSDFNHPIPRDMLLLTRKNESKVGDCDSKISEVQKSDKYVPKPLYCKSKKCLERKTLKEHEKVITNSDVSLCYFCTPKEINEKRMVFPADTFGRSTISFSEYGGEKVEFSVL